MSGQVGFRISNIEQGISNYEVQILSIFDILESIFDILFLALYAG